MFEPKGELSRREVIYRAIRDKQSGELIPYDALPYDREVVIGLREAVAKTFEREQRRTVVCVKGEGWKIVRGLDQVDAAVRKRRKALRTQGRGVQIIEATDRREMSAEERVRTDAELINMTTGYGVLRGLAHKRLTVDDVRDWQEQHGNGH